MSPKEAPYEAAGLLRATVTAVAKLGDFTPLRLQVPGWAGAQPGQFAMLHPEGSAQFLARPFSVSDQEMRPDGARLTFLVAPVGPASRELVALQPGARLSVLGPLGRGFSLDDLLSPVTPHGSGAGSCPAAAVGSGRQRLVVAAGGVGIAPFPLLLRALAGRAAAPAPPAASPALSGLRPPLLVCGFRNAGQAAAVEVLRAAAEELQCAGIGSGLLLATEDGSAGARGLATELLARELEPGDRVVVCGPPAMCRAAWDLCGPAPDVRVWFSLEARMACGVGSCHGCVLELADGSLAKVCRRGPVFSGQEAFGPAGRGGEVTRP